MSDRDHGTQPHDCGGDAAAYALGALEPAEAEAFLEHVGQCSICRDELEALGGVVAALPMGVPQYAAPARLRRRLLGAVRADRGRDRRAMPVDPARPWRRRPAFRVGAASVLAALVIAAVIVGIASSGGGSRVRVVRAQVSGISGSAQLRIDHGRGELIVHHLSEPSPGHVYEVWVKAPGHPPVPASVLFSVTAGGDATVGLPRSIRGISVVMVTSEPDGGTRTPTSRPVIVAQLT